MQFKFMFFNPESSVFCEMVNLIYYYLFSHLNKVSWKNNTKWNAKPGT